MIRISKPEKWKDTFFHNLKPIEKLIFIYLYENCDDAGFFEVNFEKMSFEIGVAPQEISASFNKLEKAFLVSDNADKIWLRKFLLHQNRLPLDLKTNEGNYIKFQIEGNLSKFNFSDELQSILKNIKKKTRVKVDFSKPTIEDVMDNFKLGEWSFVSKDEIISIYDYYESVGWKVGNKKMADWNKAFIGCFRRNINRNKRPQYQFQNQQKSKMDNIIEQNEKIKGFDFNTLKTK